MKKIQFIFRTNKLLFFALIMMLLVMIFAMMPTLLNKSDTLISLSENLSGPSIKHIFGTDQLGRDLFARTACGIRISLLIAISATIIDLVIGVSYGFIAAMSSKKIDSLLMRIADIIYAIPYTLIVIMLVVLMNKGIFPIIISMTFAGWITMAKIIRAQFIMLKQQEFVIASQAMGGSKLHILTTHLFPSCINTALATVTMTIPLSIYTESFLSFIGLGVQPPLASLGFLVREALPIMRYYPRLFFIPTLFIGIMIICCNIISENIGSIINNNRLQSIISEKNHNSIY